MAPQRLTPDRIYEENEYEAVTGEINNSQVLVIRGKEGQKNCLVRIAIYIEETALKVPGRRLNFLDIRTGRKFQADAENILGVLKPGSITEKDKLMLALIKPVTEETTEELGFWGYCHLKNGTYLKPVRLDSERELRAYVSLQKNYQSRVMVCDDEDYIVLDIQDGRLAFPDMEQALREPPAALELESGTKGGNGYEGH